MTDPENTYTFPPRRQNGVIGKITLGQALAIVVGIALPWLGIRTGSVALFCCSAVVGVAVVVLSFRRIGGRYVTEWVRPLVGVVVSRLQGSAVYRGAVFGPNSLAYRMDLPGDLANVRMISAPAPDGHSRIGLCVDEKSKTVTAALLTEGTPIILEESTEQQARYDEWESVMESMCDPGSGIARWQLLFRARADTTNSAQQYYIDHAVNRDSLPTQALYELVSHHAPAGQRHEVFFVVAYDLNRLDADIQASGGDDQAIGVVVTEHLVDLERQIVEARIPVRGWLTPAHYAAVIHTQFDPDSLPLYDMQASEKHELDPRVAGPSATERQWKMYLHDSACSSTIWVHEMPRRPSKAGWLVPLLQQSDARRSISLVAEPLSVDRAEKSISNQQLAAAGAMYLKAKHGLMIDARTTNELHAAQQLDEELAVGAGYFRYHMFITVTADDPEKLRRSVAAVRRRLTRIRCSSMVLYGEQDQAFFAGALPLARGLAPMRGLTGS